MFSDSPHKQTSIQTTENTGKRDCDNCQQTSACKTSGEESVAAFLVNFRFSLGFAHASQVLILISLTLYFLLAQSVLLTSDQ